MNRRSRYRDRSDGSTFRIAGLIAVAGLALVGFGSAVPGDFDDMFIVLVYARHLLERGGLYWNHVDGPVEGFTSPLDLLSKVLATGVAPSDPVQAVFWCTVVLWVLAALALVFVVRVYARSDDRRTWCVALLTGATLASNYQAAFATSFLLETPLFLLSVLAVLTVWFGSRPPLSVPRAVALAGALTALALSRPEGVALTLVVMGLVTVQETEPEGRRRSLIAFGVVLGLLAALVLWRRIYFGAWAPNTYYAKTSSIRRYEIADGARYLMDGALSLRSGLLLPAAMGGGAMVLLPWWRDAKSRRAHACVAILALASVTTVLLSGGDSYPGGRFLAVPNSLGALLLGTAALGLRGRLRSVPVVALTGVLVLQGLGIGVRADVIRAQMRRGGLSRNDFVCEAQAFRRLAGIVGEGPVAESDAQRLKYFEDGIRLIDLHGLNDREIARREVMEPVRWGHYRPSVGVDVDAPVWIWGPRWLSTEPMSRISMERLVTDKRLVERYAGYLELPSPELARRMVERYAPASIPVCGEQFVNVLVRRDWTSQFRGAGIAVGG